MGSIAIGWALALALGLLLVVALAAATIGRLRLTRQLVVASVRAVVQLAAVSSVIVVIARSLWLSALFVALMYLVACATSARRVAPHGGGRHVWCPIAAGAVPVVALMLGCGVVPISGIAIVPISGIVIGGAMTATSLAGRRALDELATRHGEYEAWLALGRPGREAALEICRPAATGALVPPLDQTRTVGLVTLPGAFVGVLLGSGDAVRAGAAQLLVLISLLAAEVIAVVLTTELVARGRLRRTTTSQGIIGGRRARWPRPDLRGMPNRS